MGNQHKEPKCSTGVGAARLFFIGHDNSGHTYVVPQDKSAEFNRWSNLPEDDEARWDAPSYCTRINGSQLLFERPRIFGGESVTLVHDATECWASTPLRVGQAPAERGIEMQLEPIDVSLYRALNDHLADHGKDINIRYLQAEAFSCGWRAGVHWAMAEDQVTPEECDNSKWPVVPPRPPAGNGLATTLTPSDRWAEIGTEPNYDPDVE